VDKVKRTGWRWRFYGWVIFKVVKVKPGELIPPRWLWLYNVLFPWSSRWIKSSPLDYDGWTDTLTIFGVRYSGGLFRALAFGQPGEVFRILKRENGDISVERIHPDRIKEE